MGHFDDVTNQVTLLKKRCVNLIVINFFHKPKNVNFAFTLHKISYIPSFLKRWRSHGYYN